MIPVDDPRRPMYEEVLNRPAFIRDNLEALDNLVRSILPRDACRRWTRVLLTGCGRRPAVAARRSLCDSVDGVTGRGLQCVSFRESFQNHRDRGAGQGTWHGYRGHKRKS